MRSTTIIANSQTRRVHVKNAVDSTELALVRQKARGLQTDINDLFRSYRDQMSPTELKSIKEAYDGITATLRGLTGLK